MDPPAISLAAVILANPLNALLFMKSGLQILIPLRALNAMKIVEPDLIIQSLAPLVATSENSSLVALNVGVYT